MTRPARQPPDRRGDKDSPKALPRPIAADYPPKVRRAILRRLLSKLDKHYPDRHA
ncbi:MAG TPA: hypothetical protein PKI20_12745 [Verrucomicrobiota bacterium]|nr:hypothetical protein [Verrucomicrobiota bacterium]HQL78542.1 hypothetical protein [Verrucomicrobiota bacterium]